MTLDPRHLMDFYERAFLAKARLEGYSVADCDAFAKAAVDALERAAEEFEEGEANNGEAVLEAHEPPEGYVGAFPGGKEATR